MEEINKEWIEAHCRNHGRYPLIFDKNFGADIKIPGRPDYYIEVREKPVVRIEITSWRGISIGAVHWYANIRADAPNICSKDENGRVTSHCGYISEEWKQMPKEITDMIGGEYRIEVQRPVTQADFDKDPDRWEGYEIGWSTDAFDTKTEAFNTAKKIAEYRFPGWEIELEDLT